MRLGGSRRSSKPARVVESAPPDGRGRDGLEVQRTENSRGEGSEGGGLRCVAREGAKTSPSVDVADGRNERDRTPAGRKSSPEPLRHPALPRRERRDEIRVRRRQREQGYAAVRCGREHRVCAASERVKSLAQDRFHRRNVPANDDGGAVEFRRLADYSLDPPPERSAVLGDPQHFIGFTCEAEAPRCQVLGRGGDDDARADLAGHIPPTGRESNEKILSACVKALGSRFPARIPRKQDQITVHSTVSYVRAGELDPLVSRAAAP